MTQNPNNSARFYSEAGPSPGSCSAKGDKIEKSFPGFNWIVHE